MKGRYRPPYSESGQLARLLLEHLSPFGPPRFPQCGDCHARADLSVAALRLLTPETRSYRSKLAKPRWLSLLGERDSHMLARVKVVMWFQDGLAGLDQTWKNHPKTPLVKDDTCLGRFACA